MARTPAVTRTTCCKFPSEPAFMTEAIKRRGSVLDYSCLPSDTWGIRSSTPPHPTSTGSTVGARGTCRCVCGGERCTCGTRRRTTRRRLQTLRIRWSSCKWKHEWPPEILGPGLEGETEWPLQTESAGEDDFRAVWGRRRRAEREGGSRGL